MSGFLFSGRYWVDFWDADGNPTGFIGPLNTTSLEIQHQDPDVIERISNMPQNRGQALDTVSTPKPQQIAITVDDQIDDDSESPEVLARAFGGAVAMFNQTGGTGLAVSEAAYVGKAFDTGQRGISNVSLLASDGTTPLVEGTDYSVDAEAGLIKILPDTVLVSDGDMVTGTVDAEAMAGYAISGAQEPTVIMSIRGYGINLSTKRKGWLEVDKVESKVSENPNLAAGDAFLNTTLSGTLITVAGQNAPYRFNVELG